MSDLAEVRCARCGERPLTVKIEEGFYFARPCRATKCKWYRAASGVANSAICKTAVHATPHDALNEWSICQFEATK